MRWRPLFVLCLVLLACAGGARPAASQEGPSGWRTLATGDEIIALAVNPANPDQLAAGTEGGGLVVWDLQTKTFNQYLYPTQPGLAANTIYDVAFSRSGEIWLATSAGVSHFNGSTWTRYGLADGLPAPLYITSIAVQSDGTVWAGTYGQGITSLAPGAGTWRVSVADTARPETGPGSNQISDIAVDPGGSDRVWVAHGRGGTGSQPALSVYDPATGAWDHIETDADPTKGPAGDQIMALAFDDGGDLWAGSWAKGALRYDGSKWEQYRPVDGLCGRNVWAIAASGSEVWAACGSDAGGEGAARWDGSTWHAVQGSSLPTDDVVAIAISGRTAFLGTNGPGDNGAGIVPFDGQAMDALSTAPSTPYSNDITAILFANDGTPWVGTLGAGLMHYNGSQWVQYTLANTDGQLVGDTITALAQRGTQLWIGVTKTLPQGTGYADGGVSILNLDSLTWDDPLTSSGQGTCADLPDDEVGSLAVAPDAHHRVWIGIGIGSGGPGADAASQQGNGVAVYDPETRAWECFTYEDTGNGGGLAGNTVLGLAFAGSDLWAATSYFKSAADLRLHGGGMSEYAGTRWAAWVNGDEGLKTYSGAPGRDPITGDMRSVAVDAQGGVWAGTYALESGDLTTVWPFVDAVVNERSGTAWLPTSFPGSGWVSAVAGDGQGRVWVGTTRGHLIKQHSLDYLPTGGQPPDTAQGGVHIWDGSRWVALFAPESQNGDSGVVPSGLAAKAITSIAYNSATGDMWLGTENGGLSIYQTGAAGPTWTPGPAQPTATPRPAGSATVPIVLPVEPTLCPGCPTPTPLAPFPTATPEPAPPPDVPEAGTIILLGAGLAGLAVWARRRSRTPRST
jgi:ligand-binding sensor domain-containing protein